MKSIFYYNSPLGRILMEADENALCGLWFVGQKHFPMEYLHAKAAENPPQILADTALWLDSYFASEKPEISALMLAAEGSQFSRRVWEILRTIPYGETITYGQIAKTLEAVTGKRVSAQAVGGAVGRNPISIIIPCHRVVGVNGSLTGYAGGTERKAALLELENENKDSPLK